MTLLGPHPLAVIRCECSDQPQEPQSPIFFRALFTGEDPRSWATPYWILDPKFKSAPPGAGVAAVAHHTDHLDVFWAADDGAIWTTWWNALLNVGRWNTPFRITDINVAPPGAAVAAVARRPEHLDVFWVDNGGAIQTNWWDGQDPNGAWDKHSTARLTSVSAVQPAAGVVAVARYPDVYTDPTGKLSVKVQKIDIASSTATVEIALE